MLPRTRLVVPVTERDHHQERTGVRFVLSNAADPNRADEYSAWYDTYGAGITRPGFLANAFRFENPSAAGNDDDPRYAAIYDIVTPDPATAWPSTEGSPDYPTYLFDDPRSALVAPALRASYALVGSLETSGAHGALTGAYIVLTDGAEEASRERWAAAVLETGLFYAASRFRIIEGSPEPPDVCALTRGARASAAGRGDSSTGLRLLPARLGLPTQSVMGTHTSEH